MHRQTVFSRCRRPNEVKPLSDIRVVAMEQAVAMPFCSFVLAELGADVVKIERPGGDVVRAWDSVVRGLSSGFVWVNANKRDMIVDVTNPQGRAIIDALALRADVFLENFAPGSLGRIGLGPDALCSRNPRLVYISLTGYGQTGPYHDRKAYDLLLQAETGILATTGSPETPAKVGIPVTDLIAATTSVIATFAALRERDRTGRGGFIDLSMFDSVMTWMAYYPHRWWHQHQEPVRAGMRHEFICPYGPFLASDGEYVVIVVASDTDWRKLCSAVDRPEWATNPRWSTLASRSANRDALDLLVEERIAQLPSEDWERRLERAKLPYGRVRAIREVLDHPQFKARGLAVDADSPVGTVPIIRFPLAERDSERRIPGLGENTDEILAEMGYGDQQISELRNQGIVA